MKVENAGQPKRRSATDIDAAILSATRDLIISRGADHCSIAAIAQAAGVTRPTVYARHKSFAQIERQLLTNELLGLIDPQSMRPTSVDEVVDTVLDAADAIRANELLGALVAGDPQFLLTYEFERFGTSQTMFISTLRDMLAYLQLHQPDDASLRIRQDPPEIMAIFVLITMQSLVLSANAVIGALPNEDTWRIESRKFLKGYLSQ